MSIVRRIRSYLASSSLERRLFAAAFLLTACFRIALLVMPFRRVIGWQGVPGEESPDAADPTSRPYREALHRALLLAARYAPGLATCYTLCLAGKWLLRRKGLPSTLYVGFRKVGDGRYEGHAWLRSYDAWISGGGSRSLYDVHSFYT
ncbi:MAG: lasso peptide biosynthesis B2 protein [Chitinophagia bacterium]|nr:lasso peptide biosynthesis B2 protein [Chitinophagia bacterium]